MILLRVNLLEDNGEWTIAQRVLTTGCLQKADVRRSVAKTSLLSITKGSPDSDVRDVIK
jgi:hypothetical protein